MQKKFVWLCILPQPHKLCYRHCVVHKSCQYWKLLKHCKKLQPYQTDKYKIIINIYVKMCTIWASNNARYETKPQQHKRCQLDAFFNYVGNIQGVTKVCAPFYNGYSLHYYFMTRLKINFQSFLELYQNYMQNSKFRWTDFCNTLYKHSFMSIMCLLMKLTINY